MPGIKNSVGDTTKYWSKYEDLKKRSDKGEDIALRYDVLISNMETESSNFYDAYQSIIDSAERELWDDTQIALWEEAVRSDLKKRKWKRLRKIHGSVDALFKKEIKSQWALDLKNDRLNSLMSKFERKQLSLIKALTDDLSTLLGRLKLYDPTEWEDYD